MEIKYNSVEPDSEPMSTMGELRCSKCGMEPKPFHDWIEGDNDSILCGICYQDLVFPHTNLHYTEILD